MENKFLFVCNFKMNYVKPLSYKKAINGEQLSNLILLPNFCDIKSFRRYKKNYSVSIGAQNVSEFSSGAHTGEVNAEMLKKAGADYCVVGHSERKKYNLESLAQTRKKVVELLKYNITPIICVGEEIVLSVNNEQKQADYAKKYVVEELKIILKDIDASKVIIAYEPIWAIGTGKVASKKHIQIVISAIKTYAHSSKILYGGSFNISNYKEIVGIKNLNGALVGGESLNPHNIIAMIKQI